GLLTSALLAAAATWRIRAVVIRQAGRGDATGRADRLTRARRGPLARLIRLLPSPSLDGNPVLWREWHRRRPSRWSVAVWGLFGGVPPLTVFPVLIAAVLATHTGFAIAPALIGGLVVAYGAAITSLGLALATWLPRMGRAIGLTAGLYVVVTIGAIPVGAILFGRGPSGARDGFAAASPFWGVGFSSAVFGGTAGPRHEIEKQAAWLVFWIVAYGLVAF